MSGAASELDTFVVAAAAGDREAFARLVKATSGLVTSITLAILRDLEPSRDVAQEVFLVAWTDLHRLRNPASFLPWLRQTARNRANDALRTRLRRRRTVQEGEEDAVLGAASDPRGDALSSLLDGERRLLLARAIEDLPDETREVVTLFYREERSVKQVSSLLGLSEDSVRQRLSRARSRLRESVLDEMGETIRHAAPGAAFAAMVMSALPLAAPVAASALTVSASKAASAGGAASGGVWASLVWLLTAAAAVFATAFAGILGVVLGYWGVRRQAQDDQERRELRRFMYANVATVVAASIGFELRARATPNEWVDVLVFAGFTLVLASLHFFWLPRIVRRRFEAEMRDDPVGALARRRRERRGAILGWTLGLGGAWVGLILKLWL